MSQTIPKEKYCKDCLEQAPNPDCDSINYCDKFNIQIRKDKREVDMWKFKKCSACLKKVKGGVK